MLDFNTQSQRLQQPEQAVNTPEFFFYADGIEFAVLEFVAREKLSTLFKIELTLVLEEVYPLDEIVGSGGHLRIECGDTERTFNGIVSRFEEIGTQGRYMLFRAEVVPLAWLLSLSRDCRIYQDMTVRDIIRQIVEEASLPMDAFDFDGISRSQFSTRDYCVQYRESHFDFISRLLEDEGVYYYFEQGDSRHQMVFLDGIFGNRRLPDNHRLKYHPPDSMVADEEAVLEFSYTRQLQTNSVTLRDFDFTRPSLDMTSNCSDIREREGGRFERQERTFDWYDYPGTYDHPDEGQRYAATRLREKTKFRKSAHGKSNCIRLTPGFNFELDGHDNEEANTEFLLVEVVHEGRQPQALGERAASNEGSHYANTFTALPANVYFVPERKTPKPLITGVQTAMVTGPRHEQIYTDEYGRVKVKFHWDRSETRDERTSCWIRVNQLWAGPGWGAMFLPRVGQEVVVEFVNGDPDRPIVTGRVYDGANMPPYELPDERTKSTIKSSSVGGAGFNEIRFEDRADEEEIFIHAQKDMFTHVENDMRTRVDHDKTIEIENDLDSNVGGNERCAVTEDRNRTVGQNESISVGGNRTQQVSGNNATTIAANHQMNVGATCALQSSGPMNVTGNGGINIQGPALHLTALEEIVLSVGPNRIRISATGIDISGVGIKSSARTIHEVKGAMVKINC